MPANVGGIACDIVRMRAGAPKETVIVGRRLGLRGYSLHLTGLAGTEFIAQVVYHDVVASIDAWHENIAVLQGTKVDITDDWGYAHVGCWIVNVSALSKSPEVKDDTFGCRGELIIRGVREPDA